MTETSPTPAEITHIVADESLSDFFSPSVAYKPFRRAWCYEEWKRHESAHWLSEEANLHGDVQDYHSNMKPEGRELITHILRYFTQQDVEVSGGYLMYMQHIKLGEARKLMSGYMARERIHIDAYDYLNTTLGLPETLHTEFLHIDEMRKMHDYLQNVEVGDVYTLLLSIAVFSGFAEGMTLFGSFVMLLSFSRVPEKKLEEWQAAVAEGRTDVEEPKGMMRGMGQIVQWSIRDEEQHVTGMTRMFREMFEDVKHLIDIPRFKADLRRICTEMVDLELAFIDAAYKIGEVPNLPKEELYSYIHYIADVRMGQLGQEPVYGVPKNPLPWVDSMVHGVEHTNFFENRATEYSRAAMQGDWGDAFS